MEFGSKYENKMIAKVMGFSNLRRNLRCQLRMFGDELQSPAHRRVWFCPSDEKRIDSP